MSVRRQDSEEWLVATEQAREARRTVGEQLRALVVEADRMCGHGEVSERVDLVMNLGVRIRRTRAEALRAVEDGMPTAPYVAAAGELRDLLREAVMGLAVACGGWVAGMDLDRTRRGGA